MTEPSEKRRFTIEVPAEMGRELDSHLEHGLKRILYTQITRMILEATRKHGSPAIHLIIAGGMEFKMKKGKSETGATLFELVMLLNGIAGVGIIIVIVWKIIVPLIDILEHYAEELK